MGSSAPALLLEGREAQERRQWRRSEEGEAQIDALPYLDKEYEDPAVRAEVNRLVQEEMRRSTRTPADILTELPPVPEFKAESFPMFARECERVRAGKPPVSSVDTRRYEGAAPQGGKAGDVEAWRGALEQVTSHLQHTDGRHENLDLMLRYGANTWRVHNQHLDAFLAKAQKEVSARRREIELLNRDRRLNQQAAAVELSRLALRWREGVHKNMDIEAACRMLNREIQELKEEDKMLCGTQENTEEDTSMQEC